MPRCNNCNRQGVRTVSVQWQNLCRRQRKKYFNIPKPKPGVVISRVQLCNDCYEYIFAKRNCPAQYWPAMVWKFLIHKKNETCTSSKNINVLSIEDRWLLLPKEWQLMWMHAVQVRYPLSIIELQSDPSFCLKTAERNDLLDTIKSLKWKELGPAMDEHLAIPSVRCPWGCSEFLHKVNLLPLEDYLAWISNGNLDTYAHHRMLTSTWASAIRPDFPSSTEFLDNPLFLCKPTLVVDDDNGASILSCRDHTNKSTEKYLHVPSSPTGSLYTPYSNQLAQAVIKSRTLRPVKLNAYSDTYQTAMLQGGFDGLDSCYLSSSGKYVPCNRLSENRDALSLSGRDDLRCHVANICNDINARNYMPKDDVQSKLQYSALQYPNIFRDCSRHLSGATFIDLDSAISLQEQAYSEASTVVHITSDKTERLFSPPWPPVPIRVHPYDNFGERFPTIPDLARSFVPWTFLAVTTIIPQCWQSLGETIRADKDAAGFLLSTAYKISTSANIRGTRKSQLFSIATKEPPEIQLAFGCTNPWDNLYEQHKILWASCPNVLVLEDQWSTQDLSDAITTVLVVASKTRFLSESILCADMDEWKPTLLIQRSSLDANNSSWDATLYAAHTSQHLNGWWIQPSKQKPFVKASDFQLRVRGTSKLVVLSRRSSQSSIRKRHRYLACLGGQTKFYCNLHRVPLVINYEKDAFTCICCHDSFDSCWEHVTQHCSKKALYACPFIGCCVSVCDLHYNNITDGYYRLSEHSCSSASLRDLLHLSAVQSPLVEQSPSPPHETPSDDDADWLSLQSDDTSTFSDSSIPSVSKFHTTGPTEGYEYPQELYFDTQNSASAEDETTESPGVQEHLLSTFSADTFTDVQFDYTPEVGSAPLHVILNHQGHLLIRQNSKLRMQKRHANFFQKIVSLSNSTAIPLVYAEAILFPDSFFAALSDGTILGALPTAFLNCDSFLKRFNVATIRQHSKTRIRDPSLLCSTDPRYQFMLFDSLVNLGLRGEDSRLVLHRGFAEKQQREGAAFRRNEGNEELYGDSIENHSNVHKLSALIEQSPPHFFFTQSCNQSTFPGLRRVREWVTSRQAHEIISRKYQISLRDAEYIVRASAAAIVQRSWKEVSDLWMQYIVKSPEEPLHAIEWGWWRAEYQDKNGNPFHLHSLLRTKLDINTASGLEAVLSKVRGSLTDLFRYNEYRKFKRTGAIESYDVLTSLLKQAKRYLTHSCTQRCQIPKVQKDGTTVMSCKAPCNWLMSNEPFRHTIQTIPSEHSSQAFTILTEVGLAQEIEPGRFEPTHSKLIKKRHVPICDRKDGVFSPTCNRLFLSMPSSQNLQFCTGHTLAQYLTKYVTSIDQVAIVLIKPSVGNDKRLNLQYKPLNNTKIGSVRTLHKESLKENANKPVGRPVTLMEAQAVIEGQSLVTSTRQFVHCPTVSREYRSAVYSNVNKNVDKLEDLQAIKAVVCQTHRIALRFDSARCFSTYQMQVIQDELDDPLRTDQTTFFSMRPPELRFVNNQFLFLAWFERCNETQVFNVTANQEYVGECLSCDINECLWLDGFSGRIRLRRGAILQCHQYALSSPARSFSSGPGASRLKKQMTRLLGRIVFLFEMFQGERNMRIQPQQQEEWNDIQERFLSTNPTEMLPIVWTMPIHPKRQTPFLLQLLLRFGRFETEYELMSSGNLRTAFVHAGLLDEQHPQSSLVGLTRRYVLKQLAVTPGSTFQFDRSLIQAFQTLQTLFLGTRHVIVNTPSVLVSHMHDEHERDSAAFATAEKSRFVTTILDDLSRCGYEDILPRLERVLSARNFPLDNDDVNKFFPPPICNRQSSESYQEQRTAFDAAIQNIRHYSNPTTVHKNMIIVGGPGVGKTTIATFISLYCLAKGMNGTTTSLLAERSKQLGGTHIHRLLSITSKGNNKSPGRIAETAIRSLYRKPDLLVYLKQLDFLCIDEFGILSAELLATMDLIFRYVKCSSDFMGGLFLFCTMDHFQLLPFVGTPAMLSMNIINDFSFISLNESVRASRDAALREICSLTRLRTWNKNSRNRFRHLLYENCNFVSSFDDSTIPRDAVFVFGRKSPCNEAETIMIERMKSIHSGDYVVSRAIDEESTTAGNWRPASSPTTKILGRKVKSRHDLTFFPTARYEFTYNKSGRFSQGQLCLLLDVPTQHQIDTQQSIRLWKAPSGKKDFPPIEHCNPTDLQQMGWTQVDVPYSTSETVYVTTGMQARRTQYGVKPRVASTIHASMGSTLPSLVTALVPTPANPNLDFSLWEAAQVVVLLSRTEYANQIYFVGDKKATVDHLLSVLGSKEHRYLPTISSLIETLSDKYYGNSNERTRTSENISYEHVSHYRPCDAVVGNRDCVYLIVSTRIPFYFYIGETGDLSNRLRTHNSGNGPAVTAKPVLIPWALIGYVTGFPDRTSRRQFEAIWKASAKGRHRLRATDTGLLTIAVDLIFRRQMVHLRVVKCGSVEVASQEETIATAILLY